MRKAFIRTINSNFSLRRSAALFIGYALLACGFASAMFWVRISLPMTIALWVLGFLVLEWAG